MINPTIALSATSGLKERQMLAQRFHIHTVLTCHQPGNINMSQNTNINESIVVMCRHQWRLQATHPFHSPGQDAGKREKRLRICTTVCWNANKGRCRTVGAKYRTGPPIALKRAIGHRQSGGRQTWQASTRHGVLLRNLMICLTIRDHGFSCEATALDDGQEELYPSYIRRKDKFPHHRSRRVLTGRRRFEARPNTESLRQPASPDQGNHKLQWKSIVQGRFSSCDIRTTHIPPHAWQQ